jgi:hypothetical protein
VDQFDEGAAVSQLEFVVHVLIRAPRRARSRSGHDAIDELGEDILTDYLDSANFALRIRRNEVREDRIRR